MGGQFLCCPPPWEVRERVAPSPTDRRPCPDQYRLPVSRCLRFVTLSTEDRDYLGLAVTWIMWVMWDTALVGNSQIENSFSHTLRIAGNTAFIRTLLFLKSMLLIDLCHVSLHRTPPGKEADSVNSGRWSSRLYRCCCLPAFPEALDLISGQLDFTNMRTCSEHIHTEHDIPVNYFYDFFN